MFQVFTDKGIFRDSIYPYKAANYQKRGKVYRPDSPIEILYYGEPYMEKYYIIIDPEDLIDDRNLEILMTFAGKHSPQKKSTYIICIKKNENDEFITELKIEQENELIIDLHEQSGTTKKELLNLLLNPEKL